MLKAPDAALARGTSQAFVPNDTLLACNDAQIALITGPNMAGKSTYIRQVALIALLAQVGCWVPRQGLPARARGSYFPRASEQATIWPAAIPRSWSR